MILLETTAGSGHHLGGRFEHLAALLSGVASPDRLGVCLDTCHAFAAGYDLRTPQAARRTLAEFDRVIGLDRLGVLHLNDSAGDLGGRLDRARRSEPVQPVKLPDRGPHGGRQEPA